jgi:hypothetical protein
VRRKKGNNSSSYGTCFQGTVKPELTTTSE